MVISSAALRPSKSSGMPNSPTKVTVMVLPSNPTSTTPFRQASATAWIWARVTGPPLRHLAMTAERRSSSEAPGLGLSPASRSSTGSCQVSSDRRICTGSSAVSRPNSSRRICTAPHRARIHGSVRYAVGRLRSIPHHHLSQHCGLFGGSPDVHRPTVDRQAGVVLHPRRLQDSRADPGKTGLIGVV